MDRQMDRQMDIKSYQAVRDVLLYIYRWLDRQLDKMDELIEINMTNIKKIGGWSLLISSVMKKFLEVVLFLN